MQRHFKTSEELCRYVADISPDAIVSFSCGKDSIGAWIQMRRYFRSVKPFYMYMVPGMSFIEDSLKMFEDKFGEPILRMPHPSIYRLLNNLVFQAPEKCLIIEEAKFRQPSHETINNEVRKHFGLPRAAMIGVGVRVCDSLMRRSSVRIHGSITPKQRTFLPIYDWNAEDLKRTFREEKIKLPVDYKMWGRSFDGIDERFLRGLRDNFPDDYKRVLEWFPLAELEILRMDIKRRIHGKAPTGR